MRPHGRSLLPGALLAALAVARPAHAESFSLEWNAPEGCPDQQEVLASLHDLLGADPESIAREPLEVRIFVSQLAEDHWALDLRTTSREREWTRRLEAPTCAELGRAASVVMALAVDPERKHFSLGPRPREEEEPPPAPPAPPPPPPPPPPPDPPRESKPDQGSPVSGLGRMDLLGSVGQMPRPALGAGLGGGVVIRRLRLRLGGQALIPQQAEASTGKGGEVGMGAGILEACLTLVDRPVRLGPCLAVEAGAMWADSFGVTDNGEGMGPWLAAAVGEELALPVTGKLSLVLSSALVIPAVSPTFLLDAVGEVHRPAVVTGRLTVGVELEMYGGGD